MKKYEILKKKTSRNYFIIMSLFSKLILFLLVLLVLVLWASGICSRSLLISCAIIEVFSTRIFRNLDLGIEWVLRCKAMKLEPLRCIVSRCEIVIVVKPTYVLFSLETLSPKGHLNIYIRHLSYQEVQWRRKSYWKYLGWGFKIFCSK